MSTSVMKRVSQMLSNTPAFIGISGRVDLFQPPTTLPPQTEITEARAVTPVFEGSEVTVSSRPEVNRRHKRNIRQPNYMMSVCDLPPLQQ